VLDIPSKIRLPVSPPPHHQSEWHPTPVAIMEVVVIGLWGAQPGGGLRHSI
jgi:hypothetical protein